MKWTLGLALAAALGMGWVYYVTTTFVAVADDFLHAASRGEHKQASSHFSQWFLQKTTETARNSFLKANGIGNVKSASWPKREMSGDQAKLEGTVETSSGAVIPTGMTLVKEGGTWKISAIDAPAAEQLRPRPTAEGPSYAEQLALVRASVHDFVTSLQQKDMTHFRNTTSRLWQAEATAQDFTQGFKPIIEAGDWATQGPLLEKLDPFIVPGAKVSEKGVLQLTAKYPTSPKVIISPSYVLEQGEWKLVGLKWSAE